MEIDPHHLPAEVNLLQQIVLQLLQAVEDKDQLVVRLQHQLAQLLRYRYGQGESASTRTSYSCLLRNSLPPVYRRPLCLPAKSQPQILPLALTGRKKQKGRSAAVTAVGRCPNPWSVAGWYSSWKSRNGNASTATFPCRRSEKTSANGWNSFLRRCRSSKKFAPSMPVRKGVAWWRRRNRRHPSRRVCQDRVCWRMWS